MEEKEKRKKKEREKRKRGRRRKRGKKGRERDRVEEAVDGGEVEEGEGWRNGRRKLESFRDEG